MAESSPTPSALISPHVVENGENRECVSRKSDETQTASVAASIPECASLPFTATITESGRRGGRRG